MNLEWDDDNSPISGKKTCNQVGLENPIHVFVIRIGVLEAEGKER